MSKEFYIGQKVIRITKSHNPKLYGKVGEVYTIVGFKRGNAREGILLKEIPECKGATPGFFIDAERTIHNKAFKSKLDKLIETD